MPSEVKIQSRYASGWQILRDHSIHSLTTSNRAIVGTGVGSAGDSNHDTFLANYRNCYCGRTAGDGASSHVGAGAKIGIGASGQTGLQDRLTGAKIHHLKIPNSKE
jgi:hypothetical protein